LGWAEIRHPFHPLQGQSFLVLKERRVGGVETLILRNTEHGSFAVAKEWTDRADPCPYESIGLPLAHFDVERLLDLIELMEQLTVCRMKVLAK
jgi:hypothetical protein